MEMLMGGALLTALGLLLGEGGQIHPETFSPASLLAFGFLVFFGSIVAFTSYIWLLGKVNPGRVSTYAYVNPMVAVFLGWAFYSEPISGRTLIAAAIILLAVMIITLSPNRARAALLVFTSVLAACSAGTDGAGGSNYSLGLAGSTLDHPSDPPTIAANGPGGTYAFVYDNQIWLRRDGQTSAQQITRLPLSNAAYIAWGPLVWSPQGRYIAFALVQDLAPAPGSPPSASGPIYYVDTTSCAGAGQYCAVYSAGTGSVYGHTYDWLGESALVYSSGARLRRWPSCNSGASSWTDQETARPPTDFSRSSW
jgi:hypothetical protein